MRNYDTKSIPATIYYIKALTKTASSLPSKTDKIRCEKLEIFSYLSLKYETVKKAYLSSI